MRKIEDEERVSVNYGKILRLINKRGFHSAYEFCISLGMSGSYIQNMYHNSIHYPNRGKMLYKDLKKIARTLNVHGATSLMDLKNEGKNYIDKDIAVEMKADMPADERIAEALETIAELLGEIASKK